MDRALECPRSLPVDDPDLPVIGCLRALEILLRQRHGFIGAKPTEIELGRKIGPGSCQGGRSGLGLQKKLGGSLPQLRLGNGHPFSFELNGDPVAAGFHFHETAGNEHGSPENRVPQPHRACFPCSSRGFPAFVLQPVEQGLHTFAAFAGRRKIGRWKFFARTKPQIMDKSLELTDLLAEIGFVFLGKLVPFLASELLESLEGFIEFTLLFRDPAFPLLACPSQGLRPAFFGFQGLEQLGFAGKGPPAESRELGENLLGKAKQPGDGESVALSGNAHREPECGTQRLVVELHPGIHEPGSGEGDFLESIEMGGDHGKNALAGQLLEEPVGKRRTLAGVGSRTDFVDQYKGLSLRGPGVDLLEARQVGRECRKVGFDALGLAYIGQDLVENGNLRICPCECIEAALEQKGVDSHYLQGHSLPPAVRTRDHDATACNIHFQVEWDAARVQKRMTGILQDKAPILGNDRPVGIELHGKPGPGIHLVEKDDRRKELPQVRAGFAQGFTHRTEDPEHLLLFVDPEAHKAVVHPQHLERFEEEGLARPRLVMDDPLDLALFGGFHGNDVPVIPQGVEPVLEDVGSRAEKLGQPFFDFLAGLDEITPDGGQTRGSVVTDFALLVDRVHDHLVDPREGRDEPGTFAEQPGPHHAGSGRIERERLP